MVLFVWISQVFYVVLFSLMPDGNRKVTHLNEPAAEGASWNFLRYHALYCIFAHFYF